MFRKFISRLKTKINANGQADVVRPLLKATEKSGLKKFSVFGNCQADPLGLILQSNENFKKEYEFIRFAKPAFALRAEDIDQTMALLSEIDVLITQNVSEKFGVFSTRNLIANLKPGARVIRIPNVYFSGYTPEISYFRAAGAQVTSFCDYHDVNFLKFYFENKKTAVERSVEAYHDDTFYSEDYLLTNAEKSLQELRSRELACDVSISDFIQTHWRSEVLFYSMNHPNRRVLTHLASKILSALEMPDIVFPGKFEHLSNTQLPLYQAVNKTLDKSGNDTIQIKGNKMDIEAYFSNHARVLDGVDEAFLRNAYEKFLKQYAKLS
ncbi:WcbI family polysaccharide biosynthesis putative acetyltransferase [Alteromonas sp. 14N.309.X.WAT.G.H12]|uniref:WcbI family polysaccharide biosynthesis putative acetyltransferase n=1 Tax=Alteromonas sp. 14N.309.X.WAT.G.H12 TaxID=3120824 RepID=UPI002FD57A81